MGVLIAKKYPTELFAKAADHTYVECGTGAKAWGCWGEKTGGTAFNSGTGSTGRAGAIAGSNERAGIQCYLVNGVCHQAANRILLPAGILVSAARGYGVSSTLYGAYGRTRRPPCFAPFYQAEDITGDLPECVAGSAKQATRVIARPVAALKAGEARHLSAIRRSYARFEAVETTPLEEMNFQMRLFSMEAEFRLGVDAARGGSGLRLAKEKVELKHHSLVEDFGRQEMKPAEFIKAFNRMTLDLQDDIANAVSKSQYSALLQMDRDERVVVADPKVIRMLYGKQVVQDVYGDL